MTAEIDLFYFSSFIFKKITVLFKKASLQKKLLQLRKNYDGIDINEVRNLEGSPIFVFIDEESKNPIVGNDGAELARNINQKKKLGVSQQFVINFHYVTNAVGDSISTVTMLNTVNQLVR